VGPPVLVLGGQGVLGRAIADACRTRRMPCVVVSHGEADVGSEEAVRRALARYRPWAVINTAGLSAAGVAERNPEDATRVHVHGPEVLARVAPELPVVSFSSAEVFWSPGARFHTERSTPSPRSALGRTRLEGEQRLLASHRRALVVRIGPLFWAAESLALEPDVLVTPVHGPAVADAVLDLLLDQLTGVLHLAHGGEACTGTGWDAQTRALEARVHSATGSPVPEASRALDTGRVKLLCTMDVALQAWKADRAAVPAALTG
ncbi:MAG TPA: sugar nucleotide-binding protein, partial [Myxococcaceae bacterium]|nr:sugar nucleotide-binding protein [Myxococcaceae bacterium]